MPKDEFGIEYSEQCEAAMKDPKAATLLEVLDYREKRKAAESLKAAEEAKKKEVKPSVFPW